MNFTELIGFIITLLAFFLLVGKQARDEKKRREHPELYENEEQEQQEAVNELLKSLNIEVDSEILPPKKEEPPPPPLVEEKKPQKAPVPRRLMELDRKDVYVEHYSKSAILDHGNAYAIQKEGYSRIKQSLKNSHTLKDAIILKEVLGPPKGLE